MKGLLYHLVREGSHDRSILRTTCNEERRCGKLDISKTLQLNKE